MSLPPSILAMQAPRYRFAFSSGYYQNQFIIQTQELNGLTSVELSRRKAELKRSLPFIQLAMGLMVPNEVNAIIIGMTIDIEEMATLLATSRLARDRFFDLGENIESWLDVIEAIYPISYAEEDLKETCIQAWTHISAVTDRFYLSEFPYLEIPLEEQDLEASVVRHRAAKDIAYLQAVVEDLEDRIRHTDFFGVMSD